MPLPLPQHTINAHPLHRVGPLYHERERPEVFAFPLAAPWGWAFTDAGMRCLFHVLEQKGDRSHYHPPDEALGAWLALYASNREAADARAWIRRAVGLEAPGPEQLVTGAFVAMARLSEVSTIANDSRFRTDPWWSGASPPRGNISMWVDEVWLIEPLPHPEPAASFYHLAEPALLEELRERVRVVRDGIYRHRPRPPSCPTCARPMAATVELSRTWRCAAQPCPPGAQAEVCPPPPPQSAPELWMCGGCTWQGPREDLAPARDGTRCCPACSGQSLSSPTSGAKPLPIPFTKAEQGSLFG